MSFSNIRMLVHYNFLVYITSTDTVLGFSVCLPSEMWREVREEQEDMLDMCPDLCTSAFSSSALLGSSGAGEARSGGRTLRASSHSPSVLAASSLELESGLVVPPGLLGPSEDGEGVVQHRLPEILCLDRKGEAALEQPFCSDEWEDRDSRLPMGVLLGLLLNVSPATEESGQGGPKFTNGWIKKDSQS